MRTREQKSEYDMTYIRTKCVKKTLLLHKDKDSDILEFLDGKTGNFNAIMKLLIREEIEREKHRKP